MSTSLVGQSHWNYLALFLDSFLVIMSQLEAVSDMGIIVVEYMRTFFQVSSSRFIFASSAAARGPL